MLRKSSAADFGKSAAWQKPVPEPKSPARASQIRRPTCHDSAKRGVGRFRGLGLCDPYFICNPHKAIEI